MSIRPVDMQVTLPQTTNVGRLQAVQNEQSVASQQMFAEKLQREYAQRQEQVQETVKGGFGRVNREKDKEEKEKRKKKQPPQAAKPKEDRPQPDSGARGGSLNPLVGKNLDVRS